MENLHNRLKNNINFLNEVVFLLLFFWNELIIMGSILHSNYCFFFDIENKKLEKELIIFFFVNLLLYNLNNEQT
jgi:hypothetical protein